MGMLQGLLLVFVLLLGFQLEIAQTSQPSSRQQAEAEALLKLSEQQNFNDHTLALQTAHRALVLYESSGVKNGIARTYSQIARCHFAQSDLSEAVENYQKARQLWRELNNPSEEAEIVIMLGFIESRKGAWPDAMSFFTEATGLIDTEHEPAKMGRIVTGIAYILNESGNPEAGLLQYQQALDYFRETPDLRDDTLTLISIGRTHYLLGNYTNALSDLQQGLASVQPQSVDAALCHQHLGRTYLATNEPNKALQHLDAALPIFENAPNPREAGQVLALIGQAYQVLGRLERSRASYELALQIFNKLSDGLNQGAVLYVIGRLELQRHNLDTAADFLRQSIAVTENIRRVSTSSDLTAAFSATVHERYESYIECLMRQHEVNPNAGLAVRAFEVSEQARARSLAELLQATQTNLTPGLDSKLAEQEKSLRQTLRVKEDYKIALLSRTYQKQELEALEKQLAQLSGDYEQLRKQIRERHPGYDDITRPRAWSLKDIQEGVIADDETLMLEYSLGADKGFVWAVTRKGFASYELQPDAQIVAAVKSLRQNIASPAPSAKEQSDSLGTLSRIVLSAVGSELNKRRIIIVADEALNYVPFQILTDPTTGAPLVANFEIINAPSASILGELRKEAAQRQPTKSLAAFGDPVFSSNYAESKNANSTATLAMTSSWQSALRDIELNGDRFDPSVVRPLFYAKRELANLRTVAGGDSFFATDFSATRDDLLKTDLTHYSILHFATHGYLDPKRPENSGLVLSTVDRQGQELNGFIGLQDIYQLRAPVDLVVLSACQTGLGKDVRGEGLIGLTRGFMYAGAKSVVASLWKVDDEATAELMKQFYGNMLQKGMTPAAALREAQNSIRQRPEWSAPYYWAAFTLQGEYRNVIRPASGSSTWRPLIVGTMVIALLAVGWYLRRRVITSSYSTVKK